MARVVRRAVSGLRLSDGLTVLRNSHGKAPDFTRDGLCDVRGSAVDERATAAGFNLQRGTRIRAAGRCLTKPDVSS